MLRQKPALAVIDNAPYFSFGAVAVRCQFFCAVLCSAYCKDRAAKLCESLPSCQRHSAILALSPDLDA